MKITPSTLTIAQLFSTKNEQFFIPAYQRRYAWGSKQVIELFEDINLLDDKDTHLLGTILLLTESHKADVNTLELVDGQQRIRAIIDFIAGEFEISEEDNTQYGGKF